jgi:alanine-glyoxylate transaminase/serine-glyoxylate transaminase/serine-pyruvate transaminase
MSLPTIDHRGPEFGALGLKVLAGIAAGLPDPASGRHLSRPRAPVAWEAALANTLSPATRC